MIKKLEAEREELRKQTERAAAREKEVALQVCPGAAASGREHDPGDRGAVYDWQSTGNSAHCSTRNAKVAEIDGRS